MSEIQEQQPLPINNDASAGQLVTLEKTVPHGEALPRASLLSEIGRRADTLLKTTKETETIKSIAAFSSEELMATGWPPEQLLDLQSTETFLALRDKQTNTSFILKTSPGHKGEHKIAIMFQTLGEHKSDVPSGVIELTYKNEQQEPIRVQTEKADNVHRLQFSDELWLTGDSGAHSDILLSGFSKDYTELSQENVAELLKRLTSEQIEVDTTLTERATKQQDISYRMTHARMMLAIAEQKGDQQKIEQAEQALQAAQSAWTSLLQDILDTTRQAQTAYTKATQPAEAEERKMQEARQELAGLDQQGNT